MRTYLRESEYETKMKEMVEPALAAVRQPGTFRTADGTELYFALYPASAPRGSVVIVHGFSETAEKYRELIWYCLQENYTVLAYDQRGHGRSTRIAPADVTHVTDFSDYVEDLHALVVAKGGELPGPRYLFSHSMGGAVGALFLIMYPGFFEKAVLSSPMIAARHDGLGLHACRGICLFCMKTGRAAKRIFVSGKASDPSGETPEASASDSAARFEYYRQLRMADPVLFCGAPTYNWTYASLGVTKRILAKGAPERVKIPVLLFSADNDTLVKRKPQQEFIGRVAHGTFVTEPAKHEIYAAGDAVLYPYLDRIFRFFEEGRA